MRIITGSARGTKLSAIDGMQTRPTSERAKEALFSTIQFDIKGSQILDLFSGTGQLALEALSRGAARAVLVDSSKDSIKTMKENSERTHLTAKCDIIFSDYLTFLTNARERKFDIIFLDPPYNKGIIPNVIELLVENKMLFPSTLIVCESEDADKSVFGENENLKNKFQVAKSSKYSISYITILKPIEKEI